MVTRPRRPEKRAHSTRMLARGWVALLLAGIVVGLTGCLVAPFSFQASSLGDSSLEMSKSPVTGISPSPTSRPAASTTSTTTTRHGPPGPGAEPTSVPSWKEGHCTGGSLVIVAHTDDDLLFINPEIQRAITAGECLHTVYVTAGDAGQGNSYWESRERGAKAAYAFMAAAVDDWSERTMTSRGARLLTMKSDWRINLVFLRLPDGMQRGTGSKAKSNQSLKKLWNGEIKEMSTVDGTNTYTKKQLTDTLTELMMLTRPTTIRTLDYANSFADTDHSDHHAVGYLTKQAAKQYKARHTLVGYQGYTIAGKKANLSATEARIKLAAFDTYAEYDYVGQNRKYVPRQYVVAKSP